MMAKLALLFYNIALIVLIPVIFVRYLIKGFRNPAYWKRLGERFGFVKDDVTPGKLWVHAVSVGEVNAAVPLIRKQLDVRGIRSVVVTCATPTGSDQVRMSLAGSVEQFYAPLDLKFVVNRFLARIRPEALVIMETELWPNLLLACQRQGVRIMFANMRVSDRSYQNARRFKALFRHVLHGVGRFCVQTETDAERIASLGVNTDRIEVTGNLKFELDLPKGFDEQARDFRNLWGSHRPVLILGSSHAGEDEMIFGVFRRLRNFYPDLVCIVVPRHPERFEQVYLLAMESGYSVVRRSNWNQSPSQLVDIVVVDTMGELLQFYGASDVAVVGGSFAEAGGHNVLECMAARVPVIFGPDMSNFREISSMVLASGAGKQVQDEEELFMAIREYLGSDEQRKEAVKKGQEVLEANRGALQRTCDALETLTRQ